MAYLIECRSCGKQTKAGNIVWLLSEHHVDEQGSIRCNACGSTDAHIYRKSRLQEEGKHWERYIEAVIKLNTGIETYVPYAFLTANEPGGVVHGIHFGYYKDLRKQGGKLKHGHGPGGVPVLSKGELMQLLEKLGKHGMLTADDLEELATELRDA